MQTSKRTLLIVLVITVALALIYWFIFSYYNDKNRTDDAFVDGDIVPVLARTDGFVDFIYAEDNSFVQKGDTIVQLDTADYHLQLIQAMHTLNNAKTKLEKTKIAMANAITEKKIATQNIDRKKVTLSAAESNYKRNDILKDQGVVSVQIFEFSEENYKNAKIAVEDAEDRLVQSELALENAKREIELAEIEIAQQETQVQIIQRNIMYSFVLAPVSGFISKRSIQIGQMVRTGTQIFSIVQSDEIWVTANFKETQIADFPIGKKVKMTADAYPDEVFYGYVETIGAATGSKFALLPPDNATGNFVKVVQRIPVRIVFEDSVQAKNLLRPGFSIIITQ